MWGQLLAGSTPVTCTKISGDILVVSSLFFCVIEAGVEPEKVRALRNRPGGTISASSGESGSRRASKGKRSAALGQLLLPAPNQDNPNLFPVGDGFGLLVYFDRYEDTHFRNGVQKRPTSKPRGPRKKKQTF